MLRNVQFKHLNLCMNLLNEELKDELKDLLLRTNDDFGVTLSGNTISSEGIKELQYEVLELHKRRQGVDGS